MQHFISLTFSANKHIYTNSHFPHFLSFPPLTLYSAIYTKNKKKFHFISLSLSFYFYIPCLSVFILHLVPSATHQLPLLSTSAKHTHHYPHCILSLLSSNLPSFIYCPLNFNKHTVFLYSLFDHTTFSSQSQNHQSTSSL